MSDNKPEKSGATGGPLRILLADDEPVVHESIGEYLKELGHAVDMVEDGTSALKAIERKDFDMALLDIRMPGMDGFSLLEKAQEARPEMSVVIITGHGSTEMVVRALRRGAADFLTKPVRLLELDAVLEKAVRIRELRKDRRHLRETIGGIQRLREGGRNFVGNSPATRRIREQIEEVTRAKCDTILITGETGTGKEVVAREVHFQGSSEESPFIAVSCPALPESLAESELFGHVKGAFTGATADRAGYFELADGGTLFLDDIGDLSAGTQAKMLRVLETRSLRRVGGSKEIQVDIRVVAATNVPLEDLVESGNFRRDLYYRLNVYAITLAPLRDRREDILPMAEHFLEAYGLPRGFRYEGFSPDVRAMLLDYNFPGNARELRNIVERAAILCRSGQIRAEHISMPARPESRASGPPDTAAGESSGERARIVEALEEARWNRRLAAKNLGISYSTLRYTIQRFRIE